MADYDTGRDILQDFLNRAGDLAIGQAEQEVEGRRYVLRGYWGLCRSFIWLWALRYPPLQFTTSKRIAITATVIEESTAVTVVSGSALDMSNRQMILDRDGFAARIASGVAPNLVLSSGYAGDSGSGLAGFIYKNEYNVGDDILVPILLRDVKTGREVPIVPQPEFVGSPDIAATFLNDSVLAMKLQADVAGLYELSYAQRPPKLDFSGNAATDTPVIPIDERWLITDYALFFALKDQDDDKAESIAQVVAGRVSELREQQSAKIGSRMWIPPNFQIGVK